MSSTHSSESLGGSCLTNHGRMSSRNTSRVTPPFFERVMVPLGLALLLLMGVGPLLAWRKTSTRSLQQQFLVPIVVGIGTTALAAAVLLDPMLTAAGRTEFDIADIPRGISWGLSCFGLCGFTAATIVQEFTRGIRAVRRGNHRMSPVDETIRLLRR